jgi:hypothetical protein
MIIRRLHRFAQIGMDRYLNSLAQGCRDAVNRQNTDWKPSYSK